ncbi:predicted protein [Streptomyces viridochromogenes DSM 40736]|uniref:Predicted protein n=2 Tax=Streptomyces viridochromogenes TaxID=1938 RepID=D9X296_STRVT|nr:predicted protein [Streptomyces viridochromogenes DSM 40736]
MFSTFDVTRAIIDERRFDRHRNTVHTEGARDMSSGSVGQWYVLVEANESHGGDNTWDLTDKVHVEGGREAALARAQEMSLSLVPGRTDTEKYGRTVFRTSETTWLVEVTYSFWYDGWDHPSTSSSHFRISVAELVAVQETPPAEPPRKGWVNRMINRG